jgi:Tol biopolymer transport system component
LTTNEIVPPFLNVFRYDLQAGSISLVSVNVGGRKSGKGNSTEPVVSADGRIVGFTSAAENLVQKDTNRWGDVFIRDMASSATSLASGTTNLAIGAPNEFLKASGSGHPLISTNGRILVFESSAAELSPVPDTNNSPDVFLRDLISGTNQLISINTNRTRTGDAGSQLSDVTPDGRFVLFQSRSSNLDLWRFNSFNWSRPYSDIYLRNVESNLTVWVSTNARSFFPQNPYYYPYDCFGAAISDNGKAVTYHAAGTNGASVLLLHHEIGPATTLLISSNVVQSESPPISADGRFVAYVIGTNLFRWDRDTQSNALVSVAIDGVSPANGSSHSPVMTADGRRICFLSSATNLVTNVVNGRFQLYVRDLDEQTTRLVSLNTNGAASNRELLSEPSISPDGQLIAFESAGSDLVAGDLNDASDVFLHDLTTRQTRAVSLGRSPSATAAGLSRGWPASVSSNGQIIAFTGADNYMPADTNSSPDIFIRDLQANATSVVNIELNGSFPAARTTRNPVVSMDGRRLLYVADLFADYQAVVERLYWRDLQTQATQWLTNANSTNWSMTVSGRYVAFESSDRVVPDDYNSYDDVFLRDMETGNKRLVSQAYSSVRAGNGPSINPQVTPDGRWVLFQSTATDLLETNLPTGPWRLFARDIQSNRTELVSVLPLVPPPSTATYEVDFTPNSRFAAIAWRPLRDQYAPAYAAFVYDLQTKSNTFVGNACRNLVISDGGHFVVYQIIATNGGLRQVWVKNITTGISNLVSRTAVGTPGNGESLNPQISSNGRFIVFESKASNLVENDTNGVSDIFFADRLTGTRLLLTVNREGSGAASGSSSRPVLSADGRTLVFQSFANDLIPGDYNDTRDVFVVHLSEPDSDGDGMDDDWEIAYFGELSHDGLGDSDSDSQTDLQEFRAGTNPINDQSILRVLTLSSISGGPKTVLWNAVPGRTYRVQYKMDLAQPDWTDLAGTVIATSSTASKGDPAVDSPIRFYRVLLVD